MVCLSCEKTSLRHDEKAIRPGAQTERQGAIGASFAKRPLRAPPKMLPARCETAEDFLVPARRQPARPSQCCCQVNGDTTASGNQIKQKTRNAVTLWKKPKGGMTLFRPKANADGEGHLQFFRNRSSLRILPILGLFYEPFFD